MLTHRLPVSVESKGGREVRAYTSESGDFVMLDGSDYEDFDPRDFEEEEWERTEARKIHGDRSFWSEHPALNDLGCPTSNGR
jgi:hypothetical protein